MNTQPCRTVLIVEDCPEDREMYRRYLLRDRDYDYTIIEASLGKEGLNLWHQHQPDAVLLDYRLPDLNGLEFLAALQTQQPLPIVMMTGVGSETIAVQAIKAGAKDYLVKEQITPESLKLALDGTIKTVQLQTQLQERIDRERVIAQIAQNVSRSLDLDEILHTTVIEVRQFLQTDRVVVFQVEAGGNGRVVAESVGAEWRSILSEQIYDPCFAESYVDPQRQGRVTVKADIYDGSIEPCHVQLLAELQVRANLVVPILHDNQFWGVLIAHHCAAPRQWKPLEIDLLQQLSTQVSVAIRQAELYQQAQTELAERKRTEEMLRSSEERLRLGLQAARMGTWDWNILENQIIWSANMEALFGLAPGEFDGSYEQFVARLHPEDRDRVLAAIAAAMTPGANYDIEFRVLYPDGTVRWALSQGKVFYDASGQAIRMSGVDLDITDRKQAEVSLRRSEEFNRRILENNQDCIKVLDLEGRLLYLNDRGKRLLEIDDFADYDRSLWTQFWGGSEQELAQAALATATAGTIGKFEGQCPTATGVPKWWQVNVIPLHDADGNVEQFLVISHDLTERRQAEDALGQSQALVQSQLMEIEAIYQTAPIGMAILDVDLRFERLNQRLAEIDGIAIADTIGRTVREIVPDLADKIEPLQRRVLETGEALLNLEISGETIAQPGVCRTWIANYYPLKDETGQSVGINAVVQEITDRKQAELALLESERKFSAIFDQTFEFIGLLSIDGVLLEVNQAALNSVGTAKAEIVGKNFWETPWWTHSPELQQQLRSSIDLAAQGEFISYEVSFPAAGGQTMITNFSLKPVFDELGRVTALVGEGYDITHLKRTEAALLESEERLNTGIAVAGVGLAKFDYATNLVELSPEAAVLYGFSADESVVTRAQFHATFHPAERAELEATIARIIDPSCQGWFAQDHRVVWPNGEVRWLSVRKQVFFDRLGAVHRPSYAILAAIDITDRKQQELNNNFLAEIQNDLAIIENLEQIINVVGEKIRLWFDFSILTFSDVDADEARVIYANKDDDLPNALGVHRLLDYFSEIHLQELQSGQNMTIEDVYADPKVKDGGRAYDSWQVRSVVNIPYIGNSKFKFMMSGARQMPSLWREDELELMGELIVRIYIEIERIRAESALQKINQLLEERNQELNRFSYIVSHDLKAPLRGISNLAAWIRDDLPPTIDPDILTNLDLMRSRVDRMDSLITGLLEYARVGSHAASLATFRVEQLLAEIVDSLSIPDSFVVELPAELPPITTNRVLLCQVLANLIGNAYKHHDRPDGRIQVTAQPDAQMWEFIVTDDGRGIAPANQAEVFDIFRTLSGADKNNTGIGLSIVKKLVETQGGEITLESQLGIGTTFKFTWLSEI